MNTVVSPLAGQPAPVSMLVDVPGLLAAYDARVPDPSIAAQRVTFGTSGHRGSSFDASVRGLATVAQAMRVSAESSLYA